MISITFFLLILIIFPVEAAANQEVKIEADGNIDYDFENNITTASEKVKLVAKDLEIEAENLIYHMDTGLAEASGSVKLTVGEAVYYTEELTYNVKEAAGFTGAVQGAVKSKPRDYKLTGEKINLKAGTVEVTKATVTRCPLEKPDYLFTSRMVIIRGELVRLEKVVLRIKGIPVFYFPSLSFKLNKDLPDIEAGYNDEDGLRLKYKCLSVLSQNAALVFKGDLSTEDESEIGVGLDSNAGGFRNELNLMYNFELYWKVEERFSFESPNAFLVIDGFKDYSAVEHNELGFSLTRKYWATVLGSWQFGVLGRRVWSLDDNDVKYGGVYSGIRLDYSPYPNLVVSYLGIKSYTDDNYGDLMEDFGVGNNLLYDLKIPVGKGYSLGMSGAYNQDDHWIHQFYGIYKTFCCFKTSLGRDVVENEWKLNWNINF